MNLDRSARGHTQNYLRQLLAERRLRPRSSLGQCFLVDLNLLDILVAHAELSTDDFVLEVGAGTGSLTQRLAARAGCVLSVEIDPGLYELARETVQACSNVVLVCADVLQNKNTLNPAVMRLVSDLAPPGKTLERKLVANLPYGVATPVISLLLLADPPWDRFVVTIQKELADRLVASPGTKDYGSLSVITQALADVEWIRTLPPAAFWPRPQVSSVIVRITPRALKRARVRNLDAFCRFVRGVMLHRRKNLRGAIRAFLQGMQPHEIDQCLLAQAIDPQSRAESLAVEQFISLAHALPAHWRQTTEPRRAKADSGHV